MLPREFFQRDPLTCARELVGCTLHWGKLRGVVVETEAYDAEGDAACHTFFRPSAREFVAAHRPGAAYVYLNYGMYWLLNVLVKGSREGFVLIRALEPIAGVEKMLALRPVKQLHELCSGPGKLTCAFGITGKDHGRDLCSDPRHAFYAPEEERVIIEGPRIGISKAVDLPWRFYADASLHVSGLPRKKKDRLG